MIQIIPRINEHGLYAAESQVYAVNSGLGNTALSSDFGANYAKHPVSVAGTFRHLVIGCHVTHPTFTVTLLVNGVATVLSATLDAADTLAADDGTHTVDVVAGDDVGYRIAGALQVAPGLAHHSTCIEFEGAACSYGITPVAGSYAAGVIKSGGALGNGEWADDDASGESNSYSICAVAGTITRLDALTYSGAPGASSWVARLRLNGVPQDGTGGTVDTTCTITGGATAAAATFSLPVVPPDVVDVEVTRTGSGASFALAHVACSVAVVPTVAGAFMLCGGSNDAVRDDGPDWKWTRGGQLVASEALAEAAVGPQGFQATGLYVRRRAPAPGPGNGSVYTLRRSGTDTALALTIQDAAGDGLVTGAVPFASGERVTIQAAPFGTPVALNGFHWGLALTTVVPPVVPGESYTVEERFIRRLRRAPHVANDNTRVFYRRFELDLERGQALASGQGSDPYVLLRISRDGGQTWGEEIRMAAGHLGDYTTRVLARRLGHARDTVFEVVVSDPIAWSLVGAWLDLEPGTH